MTESLDRQRLSSATSAQNWGEKYYRILHIPDRQLTNKANLCRNCYSLRSLVNRTHPIYSTSYVLYFCFSVCLTSSVIAFSQASPASSVVISAHSKDLLNSSSYNIGHEEGSGPSHEVLSTPNYPGDGRSRLAKMKESDAPHLQALLRDFWHWRTQDSPEFATMVSIRLCASITHNVNCVLFLYTSYQNILKVNLLGVLFVNFLLSNNERWISLFTLITLLSYSVIQND